MKRFFNLLMVVFLVFVFSACSDDDTTGGSGGSGDTTAPAFSSAPSVLADANLAIVTVSMSEASTLYWICQAASEAAPSAADIQAVASSQQVAISGTGSASFKVESLTLSTEYNLYCVAVDGNNNCSVVSTNNFTTTATADTTAPVFTDGPALSGSAGDDSATIAFTLDEAATVTWMYQASGSATPDATIIKAAGTSISAAAGTATNFTVSGLTASSDYVVFMIAEDAFGNTTDVVSNTFTTSASVADATYGIFSDTIDLDIDWASDVNLDIWNGCTVTEITSTATDGGTCWKILGTGDWCGIGVALTGTADISGYSYMNISIKASSGFKIGIKDGSTEGWIASTDLVSSYGLTLDGSWYVIKLPIATVFSAVDTSSMGQYFMFAADSAMGYSTGDIYYFDNIYFSKE